MSSDIIGDTHGGVFDPTQTDVNTVDGLTMLAPSPGTTTSTASPATWCVPAVLRRDLRVNRRGVIRTVRL